MSFYMNNKRNDRTLSVERKSSGCRISKKKLKNLFENLIFFLKYFFILIFDYFKAFIYQISSVTNRQYYNIQKV